MDPVEVQRLAFKAAKDAGIDPWLFLAQIKTENEDWRTDSVNPLSGAAGIAQIDPEWHPKELLRLTTALGLTNPYTDKPLWTEAQSKALGQQTDPNDIQTSAIITNPELALQYAAKWMWAMQAQKRKEALIARRDAAAAGSPDSRIDVDSAFDWTHDATKRRSEGGREAFRHAATKYGWGEDSGYADKIELRAPELRRNLYETIYGPAYGEPLSGDMSGYSELKSGWTPTFEAGDYTPGRAVRVGAGDTLSGIVARLGIPEADQESYITAIQAVNNIPDIHSISAGQLLWLPMQSQIPSG